MAATELNAVLAQSMEIAPGLSIMRVVPDGWELPEFTPGQFAVIGLPGSAPRCDNCDPDDEVPEPDALIRRAYSIASSSLAREYLEFYIALVHSGVNTLQINEQRTG
jgi:ferredoxin--NADP+ reductase